MLLATLLPLDPRRLATFTAALALSCNLLLGCSESSQSYATAPVSGVVTLDGQPLVGARVTFLPEHGAQAGSQSGPESFGETNAEGRYELQTVFGDAGGSVGPSRVMVSTRKVELDPTNPDRAKEIAPERIPSRYFTDESPLRFDVPSAGTDAANFALRTR